MSRRPDLHEHVHARFREAFGEPKETTTECTRWLLNTVPGSAAISVLVNGSHSGPVVWVFDPRDREDGVSHTILKRPEEVDDAISAIHKRMARYVAVGSAK